jgi:uncharacterized membrane protein YphA (DoxX/SURF4 family)
VLRIGMALVMLWFGSQQLMDPAKWVSFLPGWVESLPLTSIAFVQINGLFELVASILLLIGFQTQIVAGILAAHLLGITLSIGYTATGIRDFGITIALIALALSGPDEWTYDVRSGQSATRRENASDLTNL